MISVLILKPDPALFRDFDGECGGLRYIVAVGLIVPRVVVRRSHGPMLGA